MAVQQYCTPHILTRPLNTQHMHDGLGMHDASQMHLQPLKHSIAPVAPTEPAAGNIRQRRSAMPLHDAEAPMNNKHARRPLAAPYNSACDHTRYSALLRINKKCPHFFCNNFFDIRPSTDSHWRQVIASQTPGIRVFSLLSAHHACKSCKYAMFSHHPGCLLCPSTFLLSPP